MERQISHLVRLVDDLMEVSRITRGSVELRKETVSLGVVLRNAIETCQPLIRAGNHALSVSMPGEPLFLDADPVRLAQVFGNLINNAAKYSDTGGSIAIDSRRVANDAVITISDRGDGIDPAQLPQLFRIFARGDRSAKRNQSGLGIGLALVRQLVEMHGGRVDAESDGLGAGSRFTVRLPLHANPQHAEQIRPSLGQALEPMSILVVDDNRDAAEGLRMLLTHIGAEVRVAHNGQEALLAFAAFRPRMVLLDIGMPGMDGYEVARRLRDAAGTTRVSIVALTGWGQDEDRKRVQEAGFDHHLVKPTELGALFTLIRSVQGG
jgi:CheY-like chemotaxis protein/two-component sensor histidine kinase